jgi:hypothetical protein
MGLIKRMRRQHAVWWSKTGQNHYGQATFAAPVQIKCRWTDQTGEFRNAQGQALDSMAYVYVDRVMKIGDKLKKGELDSNTPDNPLQDKLAYDIQSFDDMPDIRAKEHLLIARL